MHLCLERIEIEVLHDPRLFALFQRRIDRLGEAEKLFTHFANSPRNGGITDAIFAQRMIEVGK